jgi:hypothetical protein
MGCLDGEGPDKICLTHFKDFRFESINFTYNLGTMFIIFNLILLNFGFYYLGKCLSNYWIGKKLMNNY